MTKTMRAVGKQTSEPSPLTYLPHPTHHPPRHKPITHPTTHLSPHSSPPPPPPTTHQLTPPPDIENGAGPASSLYINDATPRPVPTASDLLIRVKTFGLNRADTLQREGKYPVPPNVTRTLGLEFAGTIEEIGSPSAARAGDQGEWKEGDEVFGLCYGGAYAEYVIVDAGMVVRKPEELGWECCGGLCEVWFTALQALYLVGGFEAGKTRSVLWHAGASGVSM